VGQACYFNKLLTGNSDVSQSLGTTVLKDIIGTAFNCIEVIAFTHDFFAKVVKLRGH
jgi:hypothetical protein